MELSIIVPTWNEAENLRATLAMLPRDAEVVVCDGGSTDATLEIAERVGARVVSAPRGRASQMNAGARESSGDVLLFLHADGILGEGAPAAMAAALDGRGVVGGSFRLTVRSPSPALALVAFGSNLRARFLSMPYGDQGLFVTRRAFDAVGGFPPLPFLEDVAIVRSLRRIGRLVRLDVPISTGPRHWQDLGALGTTLLNWSVVALYFAGASPEKLVRHYQRWRGSQHSARASDEPAAQPD
jgi:rSAM/selenodomain-associated transferase 2